MNMKKKKHLKSLNPIHITEFKEGKNNLVVYLHDKQFLENSTLIWKCTKTGFQFTDNGGETWCLLEEGKLDV